MEVSKLLYESLVVEWGVAGGGGGGVEARILD